MALTLLTTNGIYIFVVFSPFVHQKAHVFCMESLIQTLSFKAPLEVL